MVDDNRAGRAVAENAIESVFRENVLKLGTQTLPPLFFRLQRHLSEVRSGSDFRRPGRDGCVLGEVKDLDVIQLGAPHDALVLLAQR